VCGLYNLTFLLSEKDKQTNRQTNVFNVKNTCNRKKNIDFLIFDYFFYLGKKYLTPRMVKNAKKIKAKKSIKNKTSLGKAE
jgi:hypothetical protein